MKKRFLVPLIIIAAALLLNVIARLSTGFSDFYVMNVFSVISTPFIFLSGLLPFSFGEMMILLGIILILVGVPLFIVLLFIKKHKRRIIASVFSSALLWILTFVFTTETLNCFIMYHCTPFSERYFPSSQSHNNDELAQLYKLLINESNALAKEVQRDEKGCFVLSDDLMPTAEKAMKNASEKYPQLSGYYPDAKPIAFSFVMSQMGLLGVYFPFSLEANYNAHMCQVNLPNTVCHEYAHLKGIIQEDEAGFIAFIASSQSESADFRYSGYLNALEYVHNQIYTNNVSDAFYLTDTISPEVRKDWFSFLPDDYWEENKEKEIISTETVDTISSAATDTSLKINGVSDGIESYNRMVTLLLDYYFPPEN